MSRACDRSNLCRRVRSSLLSTLDDFGGGHRLKGIVRGGGEVERRIQFGTLNILWLFVVLVSCQRTQPPQEAPKALTEHIPPVRGEKAPPELISYCQSVAASVSGRRPSAVLDADAPPIPSFVDDPSLSPADRRLRALRAMDTLKDMLHNRPRDSRLHHQLGLIFRDFMERPEVALSHFCRALLESPTNTDYRLATIAQLMTSTFEPQLELALRPGDRTLPWRSALDEASRLKHADALTRADAFTRMVRAQRMVRTARALSKRRIRGKRINLVDVLRVWAAQDVNRLRIAVTLPRRHRSKLFDLRDRQRAPTNTYICPGPASRWLILADGPDADGAVLVARQSLKGLDVGVSAIAGDRHVYLVGRFQKDGFLPRFVAMDPHNPQFELQLVVPQAISTEK